MDVPQSEHQELEEAPLGHGKRLHRVRQLLDAATAGKRRRLFDLVKNGHDLQKLFRNESHLIYQIIDFL